MGKTQVREYLLEAFEIADSPNPMADEIGNALEFKKRNLEAEYDHYANNRERFESYGWNVDEILDMVSCNIGCISTVMRLKRNPESHTANTLLRIVGIDRVYSNRLSIML